MSVRLKIGDVREILPQLPSACIDVIVTDPPYGQTSLSWDKPVPAWPKLCARLLKPTGSMWVFGTLRHFMQHAQDFADFRMSHDVVWEKHNGAGFANDRFRAVHEIAAHFYPKASSWAQIYKLPQFSNDATARTVRRKQTPSYLYGERGANSYETAENGPRLMRSVLYARSEHRRADHPTQKPAYILDLLLRYACPPGGLVLDPFAGSGATGWAADALGLTALLIEADPTYAQHIQAKIS